MAGDFVVTAACVVAKTSSDTGEGYFYKDAVLPAGVPAAEKRRLVEAGLVKEVEIEVVEVVVPVEVETTAPAKPARASSRS